MVREIDSQDEREVVGAGVLGLQSMGVFTVAEPYGEHATVGPGPKIIYLVQGCVLSAIMSNNEHRRLRNIIENTPSI
jgi:hypothetical protein